MPDTLTWLAIALCITQSAAFSGLNIALFSISRLRLEVAAEGGDRQAARVLSLRADSNRILATILWGNVGVNVLLTMLVDSVLIGAAAFAFSTILITFAGEIIPQALFTRHALRVASLLTPLLRVYAILLYPLAKPVGVVLDRLIGVERTPWFREAELRAVLRYHAREEETEVGRLEATGAVNFLKLDDLPIAREGEPIDPASVIEVPFEGGVPSLPETRGAPDHPFVQLVGASGRKWIILVDAATGMPRRVLNAHVFIREALLGHSPGGETASHAPLVVQDPATPLGDVLGRLVVRQEHHEDDVIDRDIILLWSDGERRIVTGSDLLGRLLRGIARAETAATGKEHEPSTA